ncbi:hypothetical protein [Lichenihabitans psoromatis]|uniref:hypothetical protein n=1 Tax=Lichenihabitans psoromatis TaxID=2528642 RepID=UPI00103552BC|nr:hypothetical protein [Lichenihabitans psoromatis]
MRLPGVAIVAAAVAILAVASPARAGAVLDRVKQQGILHCAATERPGYAAIEGDAPTGRAADLCRAVAEAVLGHDGRFALRLLDLDDDFDRVRRGDLDVVFLEPRLVTEHGLAAALTPVAEAYRDSFAVMVPQAIAPQKTAPQTTAAQAPHPLDLASLAGHTICFMIGDPVWPLLETGLKSRGIAFRPFGFSEEVEMKDAYNVGRCSAMAGVASTLDELKADGGVNHLQSRLIDDRLGADPVVAMTPTNDAAWASFVRPIIAAAGPSRGP